MIQMKATTVPRNDRSDELRNYPQDYLSNPPDQSEALSKFVIEYGASQATKLQPTSIDPAAETDALSDDLLTSLITADKLSLPIVVLAFILLRTAYIRGSD